MNHRQLTLHACTASLALAASLGAAATQKVYRCGPDGRTYQQAPCSDGQAFDPSDPRSAEQRKAAQAVAHDEAKAAAKFDRQIEPATATMATATAKPAPVARAASQPRAKPEDRPTIYVAPTPKPAAKTSAGT